MGRGLMPKPKTWGKQVFLNDPTAESSGAVVVNLKLVPKPRSQSQPYMNGCVQVWDCERKVELEFYAHKDGNVQQKRKKIRRLRRIVNEFCDQAEKYLAELEALPTPKGKKK